MKIEQLRQECQEYVEWLNHHHKLYLKNIPVLQSFCRIFDSMISDSDYKKLVNGFNCEQAIQSGKTDNKLSKEDIIALAIDFLGAVSLTLKERFLEDLNNNLFNIAPDNKDVCRYLVKDNNGQKQYFCKVYINYTGDIRDVITLIHEYFHSLTDIAEYREKIHLSTPAIDYVQETASIFAELVAAKYFSTKYAEGCYNFLCSRIYEEVYVAAANGITVLKYLNMVMGGSELEDLESNFTVIPQIRELIQNKRLPLSMMHFIGTTSSFNLIATSDNSLGLLGDTYTEIKNCNFERIPEIIPMCTDPQNVANVIKNGLNDKITQK